MRWEATFLILTIVVMAVTAIGAVPQQGERPPQPFFQDFYSGTVTLQGVPAPAGTKLIGCVLDCVTGFESKPVELQAGGRYESLEVNPSDEALIGLPVSFYLVNDFGRIKAEETTDFVGVFDFYVADLTFNLPLPVPTPIPTVTPTMQPTPTAILPVPGDPAITAIPRLALIVGAVAVAAGAGMILLARRRLD
ncbi:MAG: hypothetical protein BZY75_04745 [SAR202 cluster bacterium Io17-Chloro-G7]|nr:MAG: hypothetical protein BZY75_04745 [SAR202 cluster bacterium Io17-Chloro-G7]